MDEEEETTWPREGYFTRWWDVCCFAPLESFCGATKHSNRKCFREISNTNTKWKERKRNGITKLQIHRDMHTSRAIVRYLSFRQLQFRKIYIKGRRASVPKLFDLSRKTYLYTANEKQYLISLLLMKKQLIEIFFGIYNIMIHSIIIFTNINKLQKPLKLIQFKIKQ